MGDDFTRLPDLASRRLGGSVVYANDELFAERENLIKPEAPAYSTYTFGHKGQVYDGWETRRRREPGRDDAIVRLGVAGVVRGVVVDTAFFKGNYPPEVSVEGTGMEGYPSPAELQEAEWVSLVPRSPVKGDAQNPFPVQVPQRFTHVRLCMYPDGGVARLRVHGEVVPDPRFLATGALDLAALVNGGVVTGCSNMFYSSPTNLISPGDARVMGEGWETARRRDDGNDWVEFGLAGPGAVRLAELDTRYFVGNAPGWASLRGLDRRTRPDDPGAWTELLPRTRLQPDTRHLFRLPATAEVTTVRLDVFPDGGLARVRLYGELSAQGLAGLGLRWLNSLPAAQARQVLPTCCASRAWVERMAAGRPYADLDALLGTSDRAVRELDRDDLAEALAAHPRIGQRAAGSSTEAVWSRQEQAAVADADAEVQAALLEGNRAYEERFGHAFLISASGRSAEELLAALRERVGNDPDSEWGVVAEELRKITRLRLERLLRP
ncbi:MAG TPA: allantoicase [Actinomycetes bacterium]|jgi:allantoicase|nr:allantoicase [Actinomycetes bacterium]